MAGLNYTLQNVPITILPNGTWFEKDVPEVYDVSSNGETSAGFNATADGVADDGLIPLVVKLYPINNMTHSICSDNFTIGGTSPFSTEEIGTQMVIPNGGTETNAIECETRDHTWLNTQVGITLPSGVVKVRLIDAVNLGSFVNQDTDCTSYNQRVGIEGNSLYGLIYLDPNYELGVNDVNFEIDFDGDAQPLCGQGIPNSNSIVDVAVPQPIIVTVELVGANIPNSIPTAYDDEPNCIVLPYLWNHQPSNYSFVSSVSSEQPGSSIGSINFTPSTNNPTFQSLIFTPNDVERSILFYIIPKPGYKLSRNMLIPKSTHGGIGIDVDGETQSSNVNYEMFQLPSLPQMNPLPDLTNENQSTYDSFPPHNMVFDSYYPSTLWDNINVLVDGVSTAYDSLSFGIGQSLQSYWSNKDLGLQVSELSSSDAPELFLIDTISPTLNNQYFNADASGNVEDNLGVYGEGYNFGTTGSSAGTIPDGYCPSDFNGNAVLVGVNHLRDFKPGQNNYPAEIKIQIKGAAVEDDGSECVNVDIQIDECNDGTDSEGNEC